MAAAASTVLVLLDGAIFSADVITLTPEVFSMTAGTEWRVLQLIRIIATVDTGTYRSFVTASTARIPSMVSWVVFRCVLEVGRRPAIRCMTYVTLFIRA